MAGFAIVLLCADDEEGAEVYSCARDRDQARVVFDVAERMVDLSPGLSDRLKIYRQVKRIVDRKTGSFYCVVPADAAGNLGLNPHGVLFDEILTQKNRELWDVFQTALSAREQPLVVAATTAGDDPVGLCALEHDWTERVIKQPHLDRRRFGYIRNTPQDADPFSRTTWRLANPALGRFKSQRTMADQAKRAKHNPASLKAFKQFELNQWGTTEINRWMPLDAWDRSAGFVTRERLLGRDCFGGLDLASSVDIAAFCLTFADQDGDAGEQSFAALWRFWAPAARRAELDERTGGQASVWAREGYLRLTEGDVIDYRAILQDVDTDARDFNIRELGYDRWGATGLVTDLGEAGLVMVPIGQGFASMSAPTKEWERLIRERRYAHGGNPVMRWMLDNARARADPAGNVKLDKGKSADKIDGCIAAVMALDRALRAAPIRHSVYEDRGMVVV
jgi:phage terminase large subunit-like protein